MTMKTLDPDDLSDYRVDVRSAPSAFVGEGKPGPASSGEPVLINTPDGQISATHFPKAKKIVLESVEDHAALVKVMPAGRGRP